MSSVMFPSEIPNQTIIPEKVQAVIAKGEMLNKIIRLLCSPQPGQSNFSMADTFEFQTEIQNLEYNVQKILNSSKKIKAPEEYKFSRKSLKEVVNDLYSTISVESPKAINQFEGQISKKLEGISENRSLVSTTDALEIEMQMKELKQKVNTLSDVSKRLDALRKEILKAK